MTSRADELMRGHVIFKTWGKELLPDGFYIRGSAGDFPKDLEIVDMTIKAERLIDEETSERAYFRISGVVKAVSIKNSHEDYFDQHKYGDTPVRHIGTSEITVFLREAECQRLPDAV